MRRPLRRFRRGLSRGSVRHEIKNEVHAEGIGNAFGEHFEIFLMLPLPLPTVSDVAVVECDYHQVAFVIVQRAHRHSFRTFTAIE